MWNAKQFCFIQSQYFYRRVVAKLNNLCVVSDTEQYTKINKQKIFFKASIQTILGESNKKQTKTFLKNQSNQ